MKLKGLVDYDISNYKDPSLFLIFPFCTFKCDKECGRPLCQNSGLAKEPIIEVDMNYIFQKYFENPLTKAIVFGGLEPFDSWDEMLCFIINFRLKSSDTIIIYTGYIEDEIKDKIKVLSLYENIIVKFGRYIPNEEPHYDPILGIKLASSNQYAKYLED
jgi:hypothetical protein